MCVLCQLGIYVCVMSPVVVSLADADADADADAAPPPPIVVLSSLPMSGKPRTDDIEDSTRDISS